MNFKQSDLRGIKSIRKHLIKQGLLTVKKRATRIKRTKSKTDEGREIIVTKGEGIFRK